MAKKPKKRAPAPNANKDKRSTRRAAEADHVSAADAAASCTCGGIDQAADYELLAARLGDAANCSECRPDSRRKNKAKGKAKVKAKVKADPPPRPVWVCLECGQPGCSAAEGEPPDGHAALHHRRSSHSLAFRSDDPITCWCFSCKSSAQVDSNHVLFKLQKLVEVEFVKKNDFVAEDEVGGSESAVMSGDWKGYSVKGLENIGNTCFFNSVLQNLFVISELRKSFACLDRQIGPMNAALRKLFEETSAGVVSKSNLNPRQLFGSICAKMPQFKGYDQQDSHELLRCLLEGLSGEEVDDRKRQIGDGGKSEKADKLAAESMAGSVFGGEFLNTICCTMCGNSSKVYEQFLDLSLSIPSKNRSSEWSQVSQHKRAKQRGKGGWLGGKNREKRKFNKFSVLLFAKSGEEDVGVSSSSQISCNESGSVDPPAGVSECDDFSWMDYIGEPEPLEHGVPDPDNVVLSVDTGVDLKQASDDKDAILFTISSIENEFLCGKVEQETIKTEVPLDVREPEVLGKEEIISAIVTEDLHSSTRKDKTDEGNFEGLGDLFEEPEVNSSLMMPRETNDATEVSHLYGNGIESNDEVDGEISLNSCLALFTKSELLSNVGWRCDNCLKILKQQKAVELNKRDCNDILPMNAKSRLQNCSVSANFVNAEALDSNEIGEETESDIKETQSQLSQVEESGSVNTGDLLLIDVEKDSYSTNLLHVKAAQQVDDCNDLQTLGPSNLAEERLNVSHPLDPAEAQISDEDVLISFVNVLPKRDATKQILISKAPCVLTLHLKRFFQDNHGRLKKINGHVSFSEILDLRPYLHESSVEKTQCRYRLTGVVEHQGTMRGGHYIAYVRGSEHAISQWFYASDSHVRKTSLSDVLKSDAYILFYEKY